MGELIRLDDRLNKPPDNLICRKPWEFRKADWRTSHFVQMLKSQSAKLESHREEAYRKGSMTVSQIPAHFVLKGDLAYTIRAMYAYRENELKMREVYYLMGLMDCMINQVNPVLRTDLLRVLYNTVFEMKERLHVHWHGPLNQILLPMDPRFHQESQYRASLRKALSLKELFGAIWQGTAKMFDILSAQYVFYCPGAGSG